MLLLMMIVLSLMSETGAQEQWFPHRVEVWEPAFDMDSPRYETDYIPSEQAQKKWNICVSFPHMKDAYWLAVNFGVAAEARRLGVHIDLVEAGGYQNLDVQVAQVGECVANGADGLILASISHTGLDSMIAVLSDRGIPLVDNINGVSSKHIAAKSLVSFGEMGFKANEYLAALHPAGSDTVRVGWFPGPEAAGWVQAGDEGFREAVADGAIDIVDVRYGETGKVTQTRLLREVLEAHPI